MKMNSFPKLLIIMITNNNHVSNVKTLQSVFNQDYPWIELVVVNDDTDAFQCERLIYNITDHIPENVLHIQIKENPYPIGDFASVWGIMQDSSADYVFVIHSGERFKSASVLTGCCERLGREAATDVLIAPLEEKASIPRMHQFLHNKAENPMTSNRDSMFFFRADTLRNMQETATYNCLSHLVRGNLDSGEISAAATASPICWYTEQEIEDVSVAIPTSLGNDKSKNYDAQETETATNLSFQSASIPPTKAASSTYKKRILWLHKNSRFLRIKTNILIDLVLFLIAALFLVEKILPPIWIAPATVAVLLALWNLAMLTCNLYFRKHPERLVF